MLHNIKERTVKTSNSDDSNKGERDTTDDSEDKRHNWRTCDFQSLPVWMQDNCYILKGYRPQLPSFRVCTLSILRIHTESVNIWTHLFGCLLFIAIFLNVAVSNLPATDKVVFSFFLTGAVLCLGFSTCHHTFHCHSEPVSKFIHCLDYCGITILIIGTFIPWIHFAFPCNALLRFIYTTVSVSLGAGTVYASLSHKFSQPAYRPIRALVFVVLGLSGVIPSVHFVLLNSWATTLTFGAFLILSSALYIIGAAIYAARIPEKIHPGKFDIWFQSHQIFHVLVVVATLINYHGLSKIATYIQSSRTNPDFCSH